jgi:parallel beta-helix repeat protein
VPPGLYRENVLVTQDNITIQGSVGAVMDGTGLAGDTAITVTPVEPAARIIGFRLSGLRIQNYSENGVLLRHVENFHLSHGEYSDNAEYGIFPVLSSNGLIDFNRVSGANDTGIYVGQSTDVIITKNRVTDCTVGIEVENSANIAVDKNTARGNSVGIFVSLLPDLEVTTSADITVTHNVLTRNNRPNPVTDPSDLLSQLPRGIGLLNLGGDRVFVQENTVTQNTSAGIAIVRVPPDVAALDPRIDPVPDTNTIRHNVAVRNGGDPDPKIAPLPGSDLLWDGSGTGNCWARNVFQTAFPTLPACP